MADFGVGELSPHLSFSVFERHRSDQVRVRFDQVDHLRGSLLTGTSDFHFKFDPGLCRTAFIGLIEEPFQCFVRSAKLVDHLFRPVEILLPALRIPCCGWMVRHVPKITYFVGKFH